MYGSLQLGPAAKGAFIGGFVAALVCIGIYFVAQAMGATFVPRDPATLGMQVLPFYQPMINCMLAAAVSVAILALLVRIAPARAWTIYLVIAAIVFLGELYAPWWAFTDMKTILALELMHVPATVGVVGGIDRFGRRRGAPARLAA
jgi:hypothetical protein